jgi:hypothetical protein
METYTSQSPASYASWLSIAFFSMLLWMVSQGESKASPHSDDSSLKSLAKPYAVQRYSKLWTAQLFHTSPQPQITKPESASPSPPAVCNYVLEGIAEVDGNRYVYLSGKSGELHELQLNQPAGDLEVTKITVGDQAATHKVSIRSGSETFHLQFDLTPDPSVPAPEKIVRNSNSSESKDPKVIPVSPRDAIESKRKAGKKGDDWIDDPWLNESAQEADKK